MKKVFSVNKFEEDMLIQLSPEEIESSKELWANKCDGLTEKEMLEKYGCLSNDDWMIGVKE